MKNFLWVKGGKIVPERLERIKATAAKDAFKHSVTFGEILEIIVDLLEAELNASAKQVMIELDILDIWQNLEECGLSRYAIASSITLQVEG